ncbi:flagellar filament capping protein FliD [Lacticigenium naphthae]|uniref:flagellar filament capping protein FliD n=1 Tax=Lacticigenium naphthae TaxID=515351 RepID=UPI0003F53AF3|nr:flagellar filament capping protein FliD [Lacticigenium naphthae]
MSFSIMGSYSGIDMATIDQMIEAESGKLRQFQSKQQNLTAEKNAWKDVNTRLDSLQKKMTTMKEAPLYNSKIATIDNSELASVTADSSAVSGDYFLHIEQLATRSQVNFGKILTADQTTSSELTLTTSLTLEDADGKSFNVDAEATDSLKDIVEKINAQSKEAGTSVSATIINDRLVFMDQKTGDRAINVTGDLATSLGVAAADATTNPGQKAVFTINGIQMESDSNTVDDAVEGLSFTLKQQSTTTQATNLTVKEDFESTTKAVKDFVDQYNSVMSFVDEQLDVGDPSADSNKTGSLVGDGTLIRAQSQLRSLMTSTNQDENGAFTQLKELGITVDRDGKATLDETKLTEALSENADGVKNFFTATVSEVNAAGETVEKEVGLSDRFTTIIDSYIQKDTGIISSRSSSIERTIEDIDDQITTFNRRLESKRQRYIKQFTALDTAMMQAESQLDYLMSTMGSMNTQSKSN